jgi:hypothetical protein
VLPLRHLLGSMLPHELVLKEGDPLCKALCIFMNRGERYKILVPPPPPERPGPPHP